MDEVKSVDIRFAPYILHSRSSLSAKAISGERKGALIRVETPEGIGFSDIHPWTELGDASLDKQIESLVAGKPTPLVTRSLMMAQLDRQARSRNISSFAGLEIPRSHFLISDLTRLTSCVAVSLREQGFQVLKIKAGREFKTEIEKLKELQNDLREFRLRFDFNGSLSKTTFSEWFLSLPGGLRGKIEFVEDPIAWSAEDWRSLRLDVPLALDRMSEAASEAKAFDWLVMKPAVQDTERLSLWAHENSIRFVVTSYLDHPLGQAGAALMAARLKSDLMGECGLLSHLSFETNEFSEMLKVQNTRLLTPSGTGLGFDDLLEKQNWKAIV